MDNGVPRPISSRTVVFATVTCFFAWTFSVYDYTLFGTLLPEIARDLGWSTTFSTTVNTYASIGMFLGALAIGPILDYLGRRQAMVITTVGAAISSGLTAIAPNVAIMALVRTFSGLGYSESVANSAYLLEIYGDRKNRGFVYSFVQSGFPVGLLVGAGLSIVLVPSTGWRGAFVAGLLPGVIILVLRIWLPESPTFQAVKRERRRRMPYRELLDPGTLRPTVFLGLAFFANMVGLEVFSILGTTVLTAGKGVGFSNALVLLLVGNGAALVGYLAHGYFGDRFGRRNVIFGGWLVSGLVFAVMLWGPNSPGFVLPLYSIGLFFMLGPYAALIFYISESFPARVRGTGASIVNATGPVGLIVGSGLLTVLLKAGASMIVAAFLVGAVTILASAFLMLGTRKAPDAVADAPATTTPTERSGSQV